LYPQNIHLDNFLAIFSGIGVFAASILKVLKEKMRKASASKKSLAFRF